MNRVVYIISAILLGFTSCVPYKEIDIQYIRKSEIDIPANFSKALILVNLYPTNKKSTKDRFDFAIDSVASQEAVLSLKENLSKSPWFESIDIPIRSYLRIDSSKYIKPLSWGVVESVAKKDTADLIISLEYMKLMLFTDAYKANNGVSDYYYGYIKTPIYCYWRVYDLSKKKIPNGYLYRDTLVWDASDIYPVTLGNQIPGNFTCAAYAGADCGEKYALKIAPTWVDDKRLFFHGGSPEMDNAYYLVYKGQWVEAAAEWQRVFARNKRKLSAKAAFNLALASEMLGRFDLSKEWLQKALKYYPLIEISSYQAKIDERIRENSK